MTTWCVLLYIHKLNYQMKKILLSLLLTSASLFGLSQNHYISGTVKDVNTQETMPFCKLTLKKDTVVSAFAVTDMTGYFELPAQYGNYELTIKFIGYTTDSKTIEVRDKNIFLGTINLTPSSSTLNTVEVKGSVQEVDIEKNEYIITDKMRTGTTKAIDVLDKVEGISYNKFSKTIKVDNEKNVLLLVNGLQKSETFIKNINPKQIAKVEVIRDPSGQYGLDGYTSVINIKLKKNYVGQELMIGSETVFDPKTKLLENITPVTGLGIDYNYTRKSLNIYSQAWSNNSNFNLKKTLTKTYKTGIVSTQLDRNDAQNLVIQEFSAGGVFGADYQINPKHLVSIEGGFSYSPNSINNERSEIVETLKGEELSTSNIFIKNYSASKGYNASAFYIGTYSKTKELRITYKNNGSFSEGNAQIRVNNLLLENQNKNDVFTNNLNLNWSHSINKKISYQAGFGSNINNKTVTNIKAVSTDLTKFTQDEYRNNVFGYGTWKINKKLSVKAGLAFENNFTKSTSQKGNFWINRPHFDLFYKPAKWLNVKLQYRANSNYPTLDQLNPKEIYLDNISVQTGNPNLSPSKIHNYSTKMSVLQGLISVEPYLQNSTNYIAPVGELRADGLYENTFKNLGGFVQKGIKASLTIPFGETIFFQNSVDIFNSEISYDGNTNKFTDWSGESQLVYINEKHNLVTGVLLQKSNIKVITPQGFNKSENDFWAFLIQKSMFKDKGSIMLLYMMPINLGVDYSFGSTIRTNQYTQVGSTNFDLIKNVIMLEMSYRFQRGKDIKKVNRKISKGFL